MTLKTLHTSCFSDIVENYHSALTIISWCKLDTHIRTNALKVHLTFMEKGDSHSAILGRIRYSPSILR